MFRCTDSVTPSASVSRLLLVVLAVVGILWVNVAAAKPSATYFTPQRLETIRHNCEKYAWAAKQRDDALEAVKPWMELSDQELWQMVPGQCVPRNVYVNKEIGCPVCGSDKFRKSGGWEYDLFERPWKVKCTLCGSVFPKNDFGKYHASGLNEHGVFDPEKADRSLLFNVEHPDPQDPLHKQYVDDGLGWRDESGARFWFVATYTEWGLWRKIGSAISGLSWAYAYTGDKQYAHKATVLLDRVADVYPDMDKSFWLEPALKRTTGKILDHTWENGFVGYNMVYVYDIIHDAIGDDPELVQFLAAQAEKYRLRNPKSSPDLIRENIEQNLAREMLLSVQEGIILGNTGMHERSLAFCAIALGDTADVRRAIEWIFADDGNGLERTVTDRIDRDGVGGEGAPGYSLSWCWNLGYFATLLHDYGKADPGHNLMTNPKFGSMMRAPMRLICLDRFTPNIGDSGGSGNLDMILPQVSLLVQFFRVSKNSSVAEAIYFKTGGDVSGLHYGITEKDPESIQQEIMEVVGEGVGGEFRSESCAGYGLCKLQSGQRGKDNGRCLWISYGRNVGPHPHQDRLGIGLVAKGLDLGPEMGYPEFTGGWPKRHNWTSQAISHNTVVVDAARQKSSFSGGVHFFKASGDVAVADLTSPQIYDQCDRFRRQLSLIDVSEDDSYAIDIFRVRGGKSHIYSFHGPAGSVKVSGLELVKQEQGTYAGLEFPYPERGKGPKKGAPGIFQYLDNVERDSEPPQAFALDWDVVDSWGYLKDPDRDIHLRFHMLGKHGEVALARGYPPEKQRNPQWVQYVLAKNEATEPVDSTFVAVLEPYENEPLLRNVTRLPVVSHVQPPATGEGAGLPDPSAVAVKAVTADGKTDYLYSTLDPEATCSVDGKIEMKGEYCFARFEADQLTTLSLINTAAFSGGGIDITLDAPSWKGQIVAMDRQMDDDNTITVTPALPTDGILDGQWIIIDNDGERNAAYQIQQVRPGPGGDGSVISLGDVTFIRAMRKPKAEKLAPESQWGPTEFISELDKLGVKYLSFEAEEVWNGGFGAKVKSGQAPYIGQFSGDVAIRAVIAGWFTFYFEDIRVGTYDLWALGNSPGNRSSVFARVQDPRGVIKGAAIPPISPRQMNETYWGKILDDFEVVDARRIRLRISDASGRGGCDDSIDRFVFVPHDAEIPVKVQSEQTDDGQEGAGPYTYNFETGAQFIIPGHFYLRKTGADRYEIATTSAFDIVSEKSLIGLAESQEQAPPTSGKMTINLEATKAGSIVLAIKNR